MNKATYHFDYEDAFRFVGTAEVKCKDVPTLPESNPSILDTYDTVVVWSDLGAGLIATRTLLAQLNILACRTKTPIWDLATLMEILDTCCTHKHRSCDPVMGGRVQIMVTEDNGEGDSLTLDHDGTPFYVKHEDNRHIVWGLDKLGYQVALKSYPSASIEDAKLHLATLKAEWFLEMGTYQKQYRLKTIKEIQDRQTYLQTQIETLQGDRQDDILYGTGFDNDVTVDHVCKWIRDIRKHNTKVRHYEGQLASLKWVMGK